MSRKAKGHSEQVVALLEEHGYRWARRNAKAMHVYTCTGRPDITLNLGMAEGVAKQITRRFLRSIGETEEHAKRRPEQIKARAASERERAAADLTRLEAERASILARRDQQLDGCGGHLTGAEIHRIEQRVEEIDRERRHLTALMTQTATGGDHTGTRRAQHRTGER